MSLSDRTSGGKPEPEHVPPPRVLAKPASWPIALRILYVLCCMSGGFVLTLSLTHGRDSLAVAAGWAVWAGVVVALQPRATRLLDEAHRRRLAIGEPFDLALAGMLVVVAVILLLALASSGPAVVAFVLAAALLGKVAVGRWEPSKDPADYR